MSPQSLRSLKKKWREDQEQERAKESKDKRVSVDFPFIYALGLPLDVVGLKKMPGVDGEKDHEAHEGGGSVRQEA
ncbi:hypothetical protein ANTQUA_LOCUS5834 [Anthophora quadrimaculata]